MAWEWLAPVATGAVGLITFAGVRHTTLATISSARDQREHDERRELRNQQRAACAEFLAAVELESEYLLREREAEWGSPAAQQAMAAVAKHREDVWRTLARVHILHPDLGQKAEGLRRAIDNLEAYRTKRDEYITAVRKLVDQLNTRGRSNRVLHYRRRDLS